MMIVEKSFDTGEVVLNYAEGPDNGPPLLLIHGFTDRWQIFLSIMPHLALLYHVFAFELRGHGKSGRASGHYLIKDYFPDVVAFLECRISEPAVLFGLSAGALGALYAASQVPEKVRAVIVGDQTFSMEHLVNLEKNEQRKKRWAWKRSLAGLSVKEIISEIKGSIPPHWLMFIAKTLSQLDPGLLEFHAESRVHEFVRDINMDTILRKISCPILLIQANPSKGALMSSSDVELALSLNPNVYHVSIEETDHILGLDTWEVAPLLRAVMNFLESLR
jgi:pimeloyl-ACP methyl ester carboxylesterase